MNFTEDERIKINKSLLNRKIEDSENWKPEINEILYELEFEEIYLSRMQINVVRSCL